MSKIERRNFVSSVVGLSGLSVLAGCSSVEDVTSGVTGDFFERIEFADDGGVLVKLNADALDDEEIEEVSTVVFVDKDGEDLLTKSYGGSTTTRHFEPSQYRGEFHFEARNDFEDVIKESDTYEYTATVDLTSIDVIEALNSERDPDAIQVAHWELAATFTNSGPAAQRIFGINIEDENLPFNARVDAMSFDAIYAAPEKETTLEFTAAFDSKTNFEEGTYSTQITIDNNDIDQGEMEPLIAEVDIVVSGVVGEEDPLALISVYPEELEFTVQDTNR